MSEEQKIPVLENKETPETPIPETTPQEAPAPAAPPQKKPEPETYTLPSRPPEKKTKEQVAIAKTIAARYLNIATLEKILATKKKHRKAHEEKLRQSAVESPEAQYEKGNRYAIGAECAVSFQEKASFYRQAAEYYRKAGEYQDAPDIAAYCEREAEELLKEGYETGYRKAEELKEKAVTADDWFAAARAFERVAEYRDAQEQADQCQSRMYKLQSAKAPLRIIALLLVVLLIVGAVQAPKSPKVRLAAAKAAYAMGIKRAAEAVLTGNDDQDTVEFLQEVHYSSAVESMSREKYGAAREDLKKCEGYQDADALLQECNYRLGEAAMAKEDYEKACKRFKEAGEDYLDAEQLRLTAELKWAEASEPGEIIKYGGREYIVLEKEEGRCLLLSNKLYGDGIFADTAVNMSWENSKMRSDFNGGAYWNEFFTKEEQENLIPVETMPGVWDHIFLLSKAEYERYRDIMGEKDALWWLRDAGANPGTAMFVSDDGEVMEYGYSVDCESLRGRGAMWIKTN